jgi:hypothetical protein
MDLAQAAERLAANTDVMYHYDRYQNYQQRWFLSFHPHLLAVAKNRLSLTPGPTGISSTYAKSFLY